MIWGCCPHAQKSVRKYVIFVLNFNLVSLSQGRRHDIPPDCTVSFPVTKSTQSNSEANKAQINEARRGECNEGMVIMWDVRAKIFTQFFSKPKCLAISCITSTFNICNGLVDNAVPCTARTSWAPYTVAGIWQSLGLQSDCSNPMLSVGLNPWHSHQPRVAPQGI
jgi:hypothetical protein